jgi:hypothetical protein
MTTMSESYVESPIEIFRTIGQIGISLFIIYGLAIYFAVTHI